VIYFGIKFHLEKKNAEDLIQFFFKHDCLGCEVIEKPDINDMYGEIYTLNENDYPEKGVIVCGYFTSSDIITLVNEYLQTKKITLLSDIQIERVTDAECDTYKEHFKIINIDERLKVIPSWVEETSQNQVIVKILPGTGFGTGSHPSTKLALTLLSKYISTDDVVLDWGTGSGILAISAKKLGAKLVTAIDIDPLALKNAKINVDLNQVDIDCNLCSIEAVNGYYSLVISNIVLQVLINGTKDVYDRLRPNGIWIISGILETEKDILMTQISRHNFKLIELIFEDKWCSLVVRKEVE